ncbi:DUF1007 family protein [Minwuia thermotolerans]|nr:DUF1007 family protein [Minwuia thermotolerans]
MGRVFVSAILAAALPLLAATAVSAHPHVWVDTRTAFIFDDQGRVSAVRTTWRFDELYSAFAIQGSDADSDGKTSEAELAELAATNVGHLAEWNYFTEVLVGTAEAGLGKVTEFGAEDDDGVLVMWFVLPLEYPVSPADVAVRLRTVDPSYYVAFDTDPAAEVALVGGAPGNCSAVGMAAGEQPENVSDTEVASLTQDSAWAAAFAPVVSLRCGR